jgi:hypothetical protein
VGAIGFEYTPLQPFQPFAGLGWQRDRNGSEWSIYWTWIGHLKLGGFTALFPARSTDLLIMSHPNGDESTERHALSSADSGTI